MKDSLHERGRALEEAFYEKKNQQLLRELRDHMDGAEERKALAAASGIHNEQLLDHLLELNIRVETIAALSLIPLLRVAWADRVVDAKEREAILQAARESGLKPDHASYKILEHWFDEPPGEETMESWKHYVMTLKETLTSGGREELKEEVLGRAHHVAAAAGGILGLGSKISRAEKQVLEELAAVFE